MNAQTMAVREGMAVRSSIAESDVVFSDEITLFGNVLGVIEFSLDQFDDCSLYEIPFFI